jgi:hypothetical protein
MKRGRDIFKSILNHLDNRPLEKLGLNLGVREKRLEALENS